jgi:hypothetical protein
MGSDDSFGNNGVFIIPYIGVTVHCIASDGEGWEHVSITMGEFGKTPPWQAMVYVKNLFWGEEDCVIQYHPPKSKYVNCHPNCLHLWRSTTEEFPMPAQKLIGRGW